MNAVAQGLSKSLRPGDEILTTSHEHPGGSVCWEYLAKTQGVKIIQIPMPAPVSDTAQILRLVSDHITPHSRLQFQPCGDNHRSSNASGRDRRDHSPPRDPAGLRRCPGAGMLRIDVKALGVDTYASSSHKWMLAPKGSGLLYIRKEAQERIQPLVLSTGYNAYTAASGTRNIAQILGHGLTMDFHNAIGRDRVEARCRALSNHLRRRLGEISARGFSPRPRTSSARES